MVQAHEKRKKKNPFSSTSEWLLNISNIILNMYEVYFCLHLFQVLSASHAHRIGCVAESVEVILLTFLDFYYGHY